MPKTGWWPGSLRWTKLWQILSFKERRLVYIFLGLIIAASLFLSLTAYFRLTEVVPKSGGQYSEGVIGKPRYINPVLAQTNDADMDLSNLIFSGLFKYDGRGNLVPDLAEKYAIGDEGRVFEIILKENVKWHDGKPLTINDVIFTLQVIQDPDYKSPLRVNFQGVLVEKINDTTVRFTLKSPYVPFLNNLTFGILPKHIWEYIPPADFPLAEYNLKPIGSGPFQFSKFKKDKTGAIKSFYLERNKNYYQSIPYLEEIIFKFYPDENSLISAFRSGEADGLSYLSAINRQKIKSGSLNLYSLNLPRYFAVFFNQSKSEVLADKTVRLALAYGTDKEEIIEKVLAGQGTAVNSPLLPDFFGYSTSFKVYDFALQHAQNILEAAGWTDKDEDGFREKGDNSLELTLVTTDWPELIETANLLQSQWQKIGVRVNIQTLGVADIQQNYIRPRQYEALLFGEVLGGDPDPFAFWHSSQKRDPGLNLALYSNTKVDKLLEEARQIFDNELRVEKYEEFQELVVDDVSAVFLYSPVYLYGVDKKIKGIDLDFVVLPSKRFSQIENWYIKTKRAFK